MNVLRTRYSQSLKAVAKKVANLSTTQAPASTVPNTKPVAYWLFGMGGLVAGMVTIGGITRLTRSGLSMTDWKLQASLPPITQKEWEVEFERYKTFPEWQQRKSMTLNDFKFIYFWEYGHRMLGRFVGVAFAVPALYFSARGMIPKFLYPRMALLFGLGGAQGLIGWWMVKSGLSVDPEQRKEIRVSPYRLATHLSMAFATYVLLMWTALDVLRGPGLKDVAKTLSADALKLSQKLRGWGKLGGLLAATTVLSGAFVAGNDAGRAYNTWPLMDGKVVPVEDMFPLEPMWRNFFETTATVQFDHRTLALGTLGAVSAMYAAAVRSPHFKALPASSRRALHHVAGMAVVQVGLGISTLLMYVPVHLAATHQAGSLVLMTFLVQLVHSLGYVKHAPTTPASAVGGPAKAVAGAALVLGSASMAASGLAPRAVVPYVSRVIAPMSRGPLQQAGTAGSRLLSTGPWSKKL